MARAFFLAVAISAARAAAAQGGATQAPPPPAQQPQSQSTAGSQGQSSTAQPSSPGASSQQVVVNPPPSQQPTVQPPPPPPSSTTVVNPPAATYAPGPGYAQEEVVVRRGEERNPMATVAMDAAYGGLAGILVGFGVALVNQWDRWDRDLMVGAGAGVLVGAAVGAAQAAYDESQDHRRLALDGMNRTDKDPVIATRPTFVLAFKF